MPWRTALAQVRPIAWFAAALAVFQLVVSGWERAVVVVGGLVALVLLAALVSLTTRTTAIVDAVVVGARPLRRVGVDPERLGLLVALAVRAVPVVADLARQVREAQLARGAAASPTAFVVPLVVRSLRHADHLGRRPGRPRPRRLTVGGRQAVSCSALGSATARRDAGSRPG